MLVSVEQATVTPIAVIITVISVLMAIFALSMAIVLETEKAEPLAVEVTTAGNSI